MNSNIEIVAEPGGNSPQPVMVKFMQNSDAERWDDFVLTCPGATFFHRSGWQTVIEQAFGHKTWFLYAEKNGKIEGVLCLAEINSFVFGHALISLPFCVYGGIAAINESSRAMLNRRAQELAKELKVGHLEFRNIMPQDPEWICKDLYVTFRKTILPTVDENMNSIPRKQRAMVRKGIKLGLQSSLDDNIDRFFKAYSTSVHRLGTPVLSKKYFQLLKHTFGKDCEIQTITNEDRIVASVLSFYFRDEIIPYYGGGTDEARSVAGNDFMYWELMRRSCEQGYKIFDFGRSKIGTGSYDFKKNWGFMPLPLHYEYQLHFAKGVPENNPLNPKYQLFIKMWRRLPLPIANWLGPHIVRNLG